MALWLIHTRRLEKGTQRCLQIFFPSAQRSKSDSVTQPKAMAAVPAEQLHGIHSRDQIISGWGLLFSGFSIESKFVLLQEC